jgi:hypothetical protein
MKLTYTTTDFFGDPELRAQNLETIGGYMHLGWMITVTPMMHLMVLFCTLASLADEQRKFAQDNPDRRYIPGASFWGGLTGYMLGILFGFYVLGHQTADNTILYKHEDDPKRPNEPLNGIVLRNPEIGVELPYAITVLTMYATFMGMAAGALTSLAYNQCKKKIATLNAFKAYCKDDDRAIPETVELLDQDIEATPAANPQSISAGNKIR